VQDQEALIQIAERQLADAEEAFRRDPSTQNERRIMRAWSAVRSARGGEHGRSALAHERRGRGTRPYGTRVETHKLEDDGRIPNSRLPVVVYHGVSEAQDAASCEKLFAGHGWLGAWRNGIYDFHHFHSTAHEVLGIVRGHASVILGGPSGQRFELAAGDVAVLPAGTGHCNAGSSADLLVVGAYPNGMRWDIRRGDPGERDEMLANIAAVPLPGQDPVQGQDGPLVGAWRAPG
jgi:uncharacterized protein YjlB